MSPREQIQLLFNDYQAPGRPGAAILIWRKGENCLTQTFGLADVNSQTLVGPVTNFRLASITKQFTASAILWLVAEGSIGLETRICEVLPELSHLAPSVLLRHLLAHSSGLPDYEGVMPQDFQGQLHDADVLTLVAQARALNFQPGTQFSYCNTGYALLTLIVERLSGCPFPNYLERKIFRPLGMKGSVTFVEGQNSIQHRAYGYTVDGKNVIESDQSPTSAVLGDGGIYSNLEDLKLWICAVIEGRVLPAALQTAAFAAGTIASGESTHYGLGWEVYEFRGLKCVSHSGSSCGFRNFIAVFPEASFGVVVLTNRSNRLPSGVFDALTGLFLFKDKIPPAPTKLGDWIAGRGNLDGKRVLPK